MEEAFENMEMTCLYCDYNFTNPSHFNGHVCNDDSRRSISSDGLNGSEKAYTLHLEEPAPGEEAGCCPWEKDLYSQQGFEASCLYCGNSFSTQGELADHECSAGNQPLRDVNQNLDVMESLDRSDRRQEDRQIEIACLDCAKKFPCQNQLNKHECSIRNQPLADKIVSLERLEHSDAQENLEVLVTCLYCREKFTYPDQLNDHQCTIKERNPTAQQECEQVSQDALKDHDYVGDTWQLPTAKVADSAATRDEFQSFMETRPFMCTTCFKRFKKRHHLSSHEQVHSSEKQYSCFHCDRTFKATGPLIQHAKAHGKDILDSVREGLWPFACKSCDKRFKTLEKLEKHERGHSAPKHRSTGEKPFACSKCDKSFRTKYKKNIHEMLHTESDDRPFKCTPCDVSFKSLMGLRRHQSHHPSSTENMFRPFRFKCSFCEQEFANSSLRNDHEKTHLEQQPMAHQMSVRDQDQDVTHDITVSEIKSEMMEVENPSERRRHENESQEGKFGNFQEFLREISTEPE